MFEMSEKYCFCNIIFIGMDKRNIRAIGKFIINFCLFDFVLLDNNTTQPMRRRVTKFKRINLNLSFQSSNIDIATHK